MISFTTRSWIHDIIQSKYIKEENKINIIKYNFINNLINIQDYFANDIPCKSGEFPNLDDISFEKK